MENEYIKRNIEDKLYDSLNSFPVLILTGARQVGKTTLLRNLKTKRKYTYISLDNPIDRILAKSDPELFLEKYGYNLIIDEIQYATELLPYIKIKVDEERIRNKTSSNGMYILIGSQMFVMMKNVSESLAGRASVLNLFGLSMNEILKEKDIPFLPIFGNVKIKENKKRLDLNKLFETILRGEFPELLINKNIDTQEFYASYLQTYLERDIRYLITIKDEIKFLKFLSSIAVRTGQELVYEDISKEVEVDIKTIKNWISILRSSGIIYLLQPYSNNAIKRIIKRPKVYFMDTGLACFLAKYIDSNTLLASAFSGSIFETYIVSEIIKTYINNGRYPDLYLYYYRDSNKKEIDMIIVQNASVYPIEIKLSANPSRKIVDNFKVLELVEKTGLKVGKGGIICMIDKVIPIDQKNSFIPIQCI